MCPGNKLWEQSVNDRVKKLMMTSNIQGAIGVQCRVDVNRGLHAVKSSEKIQTIAMATKL